MSRTKIVLAAVGGLIVLGLLAFVLSWVVTGARVVGPGNVKEQWRFAYQYDQDLTATAIQVCQTEAALKAATTTDEQTQRRSRLLAYQQNYARIAAEYNARLRNAFEAKLVRPRDVPTQAPSLVEKERENCAA